jgi:hypothetical protein
MGWVRDRGLTLTLLVVFGATFAGQFLAGRAELNADLVEHARPPMVWLSVYLRHRGSAESKPVYTPHAETGR